MAGTEEARTALLAFLNTRADASGRVERFADAAGLGAWLEEVGWLGVPGAAQPVSDADAARARDIRDALIALLLDPARRHDESGRLLERVSGRYPLGASFDAAGAQLRPLQDGVAGVFGTVFAAVATLSLSGTWPRVKACRNEPCRFAFVDRTRNRSAAYCGPACSSQHSMRAYRARRRAASLSD